MAFLRTNAPDLGLVQKTDFSKLNAVGCSVSLGSLTGAHATTTVTRVQWLNQNSYF